MNHSFNSAEISKYQKVFSNFDLNKDGLLSLQELKEILETMGHTLSHIEIQELIELIDEDGDGSLNINEFLALMSKLKSQIRRYSSEEIKKAFSFFDSDRIGKISVGEFRKRLYSISHDYSTEELEEIIKELDVDEDGYIFFEDFLRMLIEDRI